LGEEDDAWIRVRIVPQKFGRAKILTRGSEETQNTRVTTKTQKDRGKTRWFSCLSPEINKGERKRKGKKTKKRNGLNVADFKDRSVGK